MSIWHAYLTEQQQHELWHWSDDRIDRIICYISVSIHWQVFRMCTWTKEQWRCFLSCYSKWVLNGHLLIRTNKQTDRQTPSILSGAHITLPETTVNVRQMSFISFCDYNWHIVLYIVSDDSVVSQLLLVTFEHEWTCTQQTLSGDFLVASVLRFCFAKVIPPEWHCQWIPDNTHTYRQAS